MSLGSRIPGALLLALLLIMTLPVAALAGWPNDPNVNLPLCTSAGTQNYPAAIPDGTGGAIVAWRDARSGNYDIYAQRVDAAGAVQWTANGVALCTATGDQHVTALMPDGAGGVIAVWSDYRAGSHADLYAQRVNAAGAVQWTANGVAICTAAYDQGDAALVSDGAGGAIIAWDDSRTGSGSDIYVQRVSAAGAVQWTANGVAVCTASSYQALPAMVSDGAGGAIVGWADGRSGNSDIYVQHVDASGTRLWSFDGVVVSAATGDQVEHKAVSDGGGGIIIAWRDKRSDNGDIYAQRVNPGGVAQWTANGVALCSATGDQYDLAIVPDVANGAIVCWRDYRNGSTSDIYSQRVSVAGIAQWAANGVALCTRIGDQIFLAGIPDGAGGAIFTWEDRRSGLEDVYAQRVNSSGAYKWAADGAAIGTAAGDQRAPVLVSNEAGGAIVTWHDTRSGASPDIYCQRVDQWGYLSPQPVIAGVRDVPNDQGGMVKVSWSASPLDSFPEYAIGSYLLYRSIPPNLAARALREGAVLATTGAGGPLPGRRTLLTSVLGTATLYWELVGTVTADWLPGYSYYAPTACDSIAGSNPKTLFMVEARTSGGTQRWYSDPDSGYSVDNLAPAMPAPFTGRYVAGTSYLQWSPSPAPDFARFRLHRGNTPGFVPAPGNLVVAQPDTGYVDAAGAPYFYKLCAVDVHGNASPYAFLQPAGTVDVPGAALPKALALSAPAPNPARGSCTLRLALPRAAQVTLAVYDQQGRRVRTLLAGAQPAGELPVVWDGRDDGGRAVASGIYFVRCEVEGRTFTRRIAALR